MKIFSDGSSSHIHRCCCEFVQTLVVIYVLSHDSGDLLPLFVCSSQTNRGCYSVLSKFVLMCLTLGVCILFVTFIQSLPLENIIFFFVHIFPLFLLLLLLLLLLLSLL